MQERSIREKRPGTEANQSPDQQQTFRAKHMQVLPDLLP